MKFRKFITLLFFILFSQHVFAQGYQTDWVYFSSSTFDGEARVSAAAGSISGFPNDTASFILAVVDKQRHNPAIHISDLPTRDLGSYSIKIKFDNNVRIFNTQCLIPEVTNSNVVVYPFALDSLRYSDMLGKKDNPQIRPNFKEFIQIAKESKYMHIRFINADGTFDLSFQLEGAGEALDFVIE